jgi:hypothetical protein
MKPSGQRLTEARRQHIEAIVARHVRLIVTQRSRRQLHARFTTRVSEGKSGEEVLA